ncbi:MAG TPA: lysylphosphatidylglycerol synthase transmembrane domain-containing protein [Anaerolineales bacterium]|nr:lysylphosphatidylglycerol synthase transmembrane domain-containing protein [Anaerolineales bacterium]
MLRKLFYSAIFLLTIFFVARNFEELKLILITFTQSDSRWLFIAMLAHILWLVTIAGNFWACYHLMGIHEKLRHLVPLTTAANFINVIAPSYGAGALAVLITDGSRRGKPVGKVSTAAFVYLVYDYLGFLVVLSLGFSILSRRGLLDALLIGAAVFAVSIAVGLIILTAIGVHSADQLESAILWLVDFANRLLQPLFKRAVINRAKAQNFALDIADGLLQIRHSPRKLILPGVLALTRKAMMVIILFSVSLAFHNPFGIETLLASFSVSYLFTIASITPSGVGFVEGAMALTQNAMGVNPLTSTAIALTYRGITFWLTLAYGFIAIRMIGFHAGKSSTNGAAPEK